MPNLKRFYVYLHRRESDGLIFYVGKGCGGRATLISSRPTRWLRVFKKHGINVSFAKDKMSEPCAMTLEKILIYLFRKSGQPIINVTDGGGGIAGMIHPSRKVIYSSKMERFPSILDATSFLKGIGYPKASPAAIGKCANRKKHTAYGRAWSFTGFPDHPEKIGNENRGQAQVRLLSKPVRTDCGLEFSSRNDAVRFLRLNGYPKAAGVAIGETCTGKRSHAYGFIWSYVS